MMEKPVRIVSNEKIRTFNEKVRSGLEHALNFMLTTDKAAKVELGAFEPFLMPIESYIQSYKKQSILIRLHSENAYQGELYWFFELKTAVALGGMLRMLAAGALEEKVRKGVFDATDQDSFGEVGNQLSGILDRAFRTLTNKNVHLRMDFHKKAYPDEAIRPETFAAKEEYVVLLCNITLPVYGTQKLTLLLPRSLYEVLLNLEIELEGIRPKVLLVHSWQPERAETIRARLTSRYIKVLPQEKPDDVLNKMETPHLTAVAIDLKPLQFPLSLPDSILIKRLIANRALLRLPLFLSWDGATEEGIRELGRLGLVGATKLSLLGDFPTWVKAFTKDFSPPKG
jgi:hypothetical protein